jgi:hypothetical protein
MYTLTQNLDAFTPGTDATHLDWQARQVSDPHQHRARGQGAGPDRSA